MSRNMNAKAKGRGLRQNSRNRVGNARRSGGSISSRDNALLLRPEYNGQPVCAHILSGTPQIITLSSGSATINQGISSALIPTFATRFAGYSEFRIVKAVVRVSCFSSTQAGLGNIWFSEDDTAAPTAAKATNARARRFNWSDVDNRHTMTYVPHDPAQQTWTLTSSGAPVVGYFKLYTDSAVYGTPSASASTIALVDYELTVQFRGFI